nr:hypothetical protein [Afipia massiliensis]
MAINIKLHTYDPAGPLSPWVHAVARYKLIDFLRRSRRSLADVPIDEADQIMAHDDNVHTTSDGSCSGCRKTCDALSRR